MSLFVSFNSSLNTVPGGGLKKGLKKVLNIMGLILIYSKVPLALVVQRRLKVSVTVISSPVILQSNRESGPRGGLYFRENHFLHGKVKL